MARFRTEFGVAISFLLTSCVILNAFYNKKQFYPSVVYLTKSNSSMAVIYMQAFVFALLIGKLMNKIFFGQLRPIEMEHLFERSWYVITETCLAFTVFRDDFSPKFVTMFTLLLFLKCFHWLAEDRVDYMERSPIITMLFHLRIIGLMILLLILDINFVYTAYTHTLVKGASVQLVFGFEYAILFVNVISTFVRYLLHTIDLQNENPWENKGIYMLYTDLVLGFCRVVLYLTFMSLMIKIHTFPLFAIRPMYLSLRSFKKAFNDVVMSRRAIQNLNIMYPDVTQEQLSNYSDTICIICREEMSNAANNADASIQQIKKLPCDHIFHKSCLRSWFQRQQTCPTCRTPILRLNTPPQANQVPAAPPAPAPAPGGPAAAQQPHQPQASTAAPLPFTHQHSHHIFTPNQFVPPPFAMPNMPLPPFAFMPPPLPTLNLAPSLSLEELAEMEGNERHNVEARIHCLRNISVLLNVSMVNMQQYMNICAATSHLENLNKTRSTISNIEHDLKHMNAASLPTTSAAANQQEPATTKKSDILIAEATSSNNLTDTNSDSNPFDMLADEEQLNEFKENVKPESDDIRKRRLQHFSTAQLD